MKTLPSRKIDDHEPSWVKAPATLSIQIDIMIRDKMGGWAEGQACADLEEIFELVFICFGTETAPLPVTQYHTLCTHQINIVMQVTRSMALIGINMWICVLLYHPMIIPHICFLYNRCKQECGHNWSKKQQIKRELIYLQIIQMLKKTQKYVRKKSICVLWISFLI